MEKKLTVLAFGAHPDDLELFMGGTLVKYKEQGHDVHMVVVTDGRRGGSNPGEELAKTRRNEAIKSAAHIGATPIFLDYEDGRLMYDKDSYERVIEVCKSIKPDVVLTHAPNDYHSDHRAVSRIVTDASWVPVLYADTLLSVGFEPEFYIDITDQFETKKNMMKEHISQIYGFPIIEFAEMSNRLRGAQINFQTNRYAEAFRLLNRAGAMKGYDLLPK